jgi:hypothetical protein
MVSILVLMDYALEVFNTKRSLAQKLVSILVLMDYALEAMMDGIFCKVEARFNPCSNGLCSRRKKPQIGRNGVFLCFNPCSNGLCSRSSCKVIGNIVRLLFQSLF